MDKENIIFAVGALISSFILVCILFFAGIISYPISQGMEIGRRTLSAENVIYNYEWFYNQNAEYETTRINLRNYEQELNRFLANAGPRSSWDLLTVREESRLRVEVNGFRAHLTSIASEYNAHAQMANRGWLRSRNLPASLAQE